MATLSSAAAALQLLNEFQQAQADRALLYTRFNSGFREFLSHGQERVYTQLIQEMTPAFAAVSRQVINIESQLKGDAVQRPDLAGLLRSVQELERKKLQLTLSWQALRAAHAAGRFSWQSSADRPRISGLQGSQLQQQQQLAQQQQLRALLDRLQVSQTANGDVAFEQNAEIDNVPGPSANGLMPANSGGPGVSHGSQGNAHVGRHTHSCDQQQAHSSLLAAAGPQSAAVDNSSTAGHPNATDSSRSGSSQVQHQQQGCCDHHCQHDGLPDPLEPSEAEYQAAVREALQELDVCVNDINEVLQEVQDAAQQLSAAAA